MSQSLPANDRFIIRCSEDAMQSSLSGPVVYIYIETFVNYSFLCLLLSVLYPDVDG